ncbi:MAG: MBL fold metallo-hydrolase [Deltaproteobacteria bacterium]|nr:MBL fold metallo-hydrolase [Deltaproteobacteria bacterium]
MKNHFIPANKFPIKIDENIFILGNYFFNLFLIIGDRQTALFEVGISAIVDTVINQMEHLDISPDFIIPSHPHSDHITGLPGLAKRYPKAGIMAAKGAKEFIEHPKAAPLLIKEDHFMSKSLAGLNIQPGRPPLESIPDLEGSIVINSKHSIDLGKITLDLTKVDGHSPGNLIGAVNEKSILFCSDSIGFHFPGRGYLPLFFTHADSYISTFEFIKKSCPSIICPAHQGPMAGKKAASAIQESFDITLDTIKKIKTSKLSDQTLAMSIFEQNYKDEFTLYTRDNIKNCAKLLVKRAKEAAINP